MHDRMAERCQCGISRKQNDVIKRIDNQVFCNAMCAAFHLLLKPWNPPIRGHPEPVPKSTPKP